MEGLVCVARDISERKRAEEYEKINERRLEFLLELNQKIRNFTEQETFDFVLDMAVELTDSKIGYLHTVNEDQKTITLVSWNKEALKSCEVIHETHYPLDAAGIWADCVRLKKPVIHNDYQNLPERRGYPEGHTHLIRHMSVPVLDGNAVQMIIGVGNKEAEYTELDVSQLQLVANEVQKIVMRHRAEVALQRSENRFLRVVKAVPDILYTATLPGITMSYVSPAITRLLGFTPEEWIRTPKYWLRQIHKQDRRRVWTEINAVLKKGKSYTFRYRLLHKDGKTLLWFEDHGTFEHDESGKPVALHGVMTDITDRQFAEEEISRQSNVRGAINRILLERLRCETEEELAKFCLSVAEELTDSKFGFFGELNGKGLFDTMAISNPGWDACDIPEDQINRMIKGMPISGVDRGTMREGKPRIVNGEEAIKNHPDHVELPEGHPKLTCFLGVPFKYKGEVIGMIGLGNKEGGYDIADQDNVEALSVSMVEALKNKRAEGHVEHLASYDSLTDLPNRNMIMQSLNQALEQVSRRGGAAAVMFVDLDEFKLVNDTLGHAAGDELLRQAAKRLKSSTRGTDIVARQGGDEFIVLLARYGKRIADTELSQEATAVAQRILEEIRKPFQLQEEEAYISASIGISLFPDDAEDAAQLIQHADSAMYRAKELGRGNYQFFSIELTERQQKKMSLATMLHKAIEDQEFVLHYQPLIDLTNGKMFGVEALIRWEHEKGTLISPADFLPVAEDTGLILPIGDWVMREACRQAGEWTDKGISLIVAINLSARQMWQGDIASKVLGIIDETGVPKEMLEFEVTESAMVIDPERMDKILACFKDNGIKISLDDFGTGYSSLNRLKHLPFHKLKIDKSFVDGVPDDKDDVAIVTATVHMARSLGLYSLAEGVETVEQYGFLKRLGCDFGQGYYFSRPVSAREVERLHEKKQLWLLEPE